MKSARISPILAATALLVAISACSDPAANKPDAVVQEPQSEGRVAAPAGADTKTLELSPESEIGFIGSKVTGSHDGGFKKFQGQVTLVNGNPAGSKIEMTIDANSLWADDDKLTEHLKSADFFDVATYPEASFVSTEIASDPEGDFLVTGNLTLHGVTKQITFPARIEVLNEGVKAGAEFTIKRSDFGIVYPGKPDDLIREEVVIKLDIKTVGLENSDGAEEDQDGGEEEGEQTK